MNKTFALRFATAAIALTVFAASHQALAVTADGTLGATSTGTTDISLTIAEQFQISDMDALALGNFAGSDMNANDDVCVYHNGDGSYRVTITDDSTGGTAFEMNDAADANQIAYAVSWNAATGVTGNQAVTYNSPLTFTAGSANIQAADCSTGGLSGNIEVDVLAVDISAVPAGTYDAEISVLIEAD